MSKPRKNFDADHIFDYVKLNRWFAICSILLLISCIAMIMKDYNREWKAWQREFRSLEIEKTEKLTEEVREKLASDSEYQEATEALKTANAAAQKGETEIFEVQKKADVIEGERFALQGEHQIQKSILDALRYQLQEVKNHHLERLPKIQKKYDELEEKVRNLRLEKEKKEGALTQYTSRLSELKQDRKNAAAAVVKLESDLQRLERKAKSIERSFVNDIFRDAPLLDFIAPSLKVKEIITTDLFMDYNFTKVPRIDACTTCHIAIDVEGYEDQPNPLKTHPDLETFLSSNSSHPIKEYGCTVCHLGMGGSLSFTNAGHTPEDEAQGKEWEDKYDWHRLHHWEEPMLATKYTEATCYGCHQKDVVVPKAKKLNAGLRLMETKGCWSCHKIEGWDKMRTRGPSLVKIKGKVPEEKSNWTYQWVRNPYSFRPTTHMPQFYDLSNSRTPYWLERNGAEVESIIAYLYENSEDYENPEMDLSGGNVEKGKELFGQVGCLGCHAMDDFPIDDPNRKAPELSGIGSKLEPGFIAGWIKNPKAYWPETQMPSLRLTDEEVANITAYLGTKRNTAFEKLKRPTLNQSMLSSVVLEYLEKSLPTEKAKAELATMSLRDQKAYLGQRMISRHACFSCHKIKGFEKAKPIGTELTEEASKHITKFDFGFTGIEHTVPSFLYTKIMDPRVFDQGKVLANQDIARMPNFNFSKEEGESVMTALLGLREYEINENKKPKPTDLNLAIWKGRRQHLEYNCRGCHIIEGEGGKVLNYYEDGSFGPPNLQGEGVKVKPEWLYGFLQTPETLRPWLKIRMPSFDFDHPKLNGIIEYFRGLEDMDMSIEKPVELNSDPKHLAFGKEVYEQLRCETCHKAMITEDMDLSNAAPSFYLTKKRLRYNWIDDWLRDPSKLLPGTRMPNLFYFEGQAFYEDTEERLTAIRDYLYHYEEMRGKQKK